MNLSDTRRTRLTVAAVAVVLLVGGFIFAFVRSEPAIQSAVVAGFGAMFLAIYSFAEQQKRAQQEAHRAEKVAAYSEFYNIMFQILKLSNEGGSVKEYLAGDDIKQIMFRFIRNVLFYGSPEVLITCSNWMHGSGAVGDGERMLNVGRLLLAMRKDIGLSNSKLDAQKIIGFITREKPQQ
jgi:hypothetical protein